MSVSDKILDAIQLVAQSYVKKAGYDKTIQAQIVSCEDETIGKYRCRYQDAIFYAYSGSADVKYTKGSSVYILVPGNDMTKDKTILGSTDKLGMNYISQAEGDQAYNIIGNNCITSNNILYLDSNNKNYKYVIYDANSNNNAVNIDITALQHYIKESSFLIIGGMFKTSIPLERQSGGHYGITYNLRFLDNTSNNEVIRSYTINEDNMVGNPYRLLYDTRQYQIFEIDGSNFIQVESIEIFNKDFPNADGNITTGALNSGDIEISALELFNANRMTSEEINGVAISFFTPQGTFFIEGDTDDKAITAQVRVKGKLVSSAQNIAFYWGIENIGISSRSEYYNKYLGQGWKCLNDKNIITSNEYEDPIIEWIPSTDTYIVKFSQVTAKDNKFKVAVVYNDNVIVKQINIQNLAVNTPVLTIESNDGTQFYYDNGHPTLVCKIDGNEELNGYHYYWGYENNKGLFQPLSVTTEENQNYSNAVAALQTLQNEIANGTKFANAQAENLIDKQTIVEQYKFIQRVQNNKIYNVQIRNITNFGTFKCSVYKDIQVNNEIETIYCGTCSLTLINSLQGQGVYSLVINNGSAAFQYDENGVAPNSKSLDVQQEIKALSFTIYDNFGKPIEEENISNTNNCKIRWGLPIKDTMLVDSSENGEQSNIDDSETYKYYDNTLNLFYNIAQRYDVKKQVNQIKLTVDYKGINLSAETNFTFTKQGEPGTNGTEYLVKLIPNTDMINPPAWPMITKAGSVYLLNYTLPNTQENQYINESAIAINSGYQLFKAQLWHSGELVWEGMQASTPALDGITTPSVVNWEILRNKYNLTTVDDSAFSIVDAATGLISYSGDHLQSALNTPLANIIKCSITWQNKTYYGTIPIITAWTSNINFRVSLKDYTGFRYVTYTSDGISPRYDNAHPFEFICKEKINNIWEDISTIVGDHAINYIPSSCGNTKAATDGTVINANLLTLLNDSTLNLNQKRYRPSSRYNGECVNAAVTCIFRQQGSTVIGRIHIPIHFLLNKYGLSNINAWDGNSIEINEDGGYILSPQMGAGVKDANNNFTGVLMGEVKTPVKNSSDIGLLGYNSGDRTFFLNSQNGSALFGKQGNGQIILDPDSDKALLYSNNFWKNYNENGLPSNYNSTNENNQGLLIDLTTPSIRYGNGKFSVNNQGVLHAEEANISGAITATSLSLGNGVTVPKESVAGLTNQITTYANSILNNFINGQYATDMESIQGQIDGNITTWFYDYEPTLNNIPASDWTTITDRTNHLGDLFYDSTTGYCYRFQSNAVDQQNPGLNDFEWVQVTDDAVAKALQAAQAAQDTADHKRRVFVQTPTPPYDIGDLWVQGGTGDIMCCRTSKQQGNYDAQDWYKASKYTDDTAIQTFINGTYSTDLQNVKNQLDQKIETWYQSTNPSTNWTTSDLRLEHEGDLWYYTGTTTTTQPILEQNSTYRWNGTAWVKQNVPKAVFDAIDGKAQVFVNQPTTQDSYSPGDLWTDGNDLWRCVSAKNAGTAFSQDDWQLATNYVDANDVQTAIGQIQQDLQEQIDARIQTFAQATDPAKTPSNWNNLEKLKHNGDLWYYIGTTELTTTKDSQNNNIKPSKTYKYVATENNGTVTGVWILYESPSKSLFDLADGKATVYYGTHPFTTVTDMKAKDLAIDSATNKIYRYDSSNGWVEVANYQNALDDLQDQLKQQIDNKIETWVSNANPANNWSTTARPQHNGDLWYYNGTTSIIVGSVTIAPTKTYQYNASNNTWVLYNSPATSLFDLADGKSTIFYGITTDTTIKNQAKVNDYLVGIDSGNTKQKGHTYKYDGTNWVEVSDYNTAITNALTGYIKEDGTIGTQIPVWESGKSYTTNKYVQYQGQIYKCIRAHTSSSSIIPTNTTYWTADTPNAFVVSNDGLLTASNAVIYGTVYASSGRFAGDVTANSLTLGQGVSIAGTNITGVLKSSNYDSSGGTAGFSANLNTGQISAPSLELSITGAATSAANSYTDNAVSGVVSEANNYTDTKISAIPGQIRTEVTEAVGNIQIGGTNFMHRTAEMPASSTQSADYYWLSSGGTRSNNDLGPFPIAGLKSAIRITNTDGEVKTLGTAQRSLPYYQAGKTYSQGCWIRASVAGLTIRLQALYASSTQKTEREEVGVTSTNWTYYKLEGKMLVGEQSENYLAGYVYVTDIPVNGWFEVCGIKVEQGNKATAWSPHPEDYQNYVSENYSTITQTADQISTAVTSVNTYTDNKVSNIRIGGRNILKNSATKNAYIWSTAANNGGTMTTNTNISVSEWGATDAFEMTGSAGSTSGLFGILSGIYANSQISIANQAYVFSIYIWNKGSDTIWVGLNSLGSAIAVAAGEKKRVVSSGATGNGSSNVQFTFSTRAASNTYDIVYWHPQIEYGNTATDWSPAPEDTQVGGTNLLKDSESMASWYKGSTCTVSEGIATLAGTSSAWTAVLSTSKYDASLYDGTTEYICSFEYKSTAASETHFVICATAASMSSTSYTRTKYVNWIPPFSLPSSGGRWVKYTLPARTISQAQLVNGSGNVVSGYLSMYSRTDNASVQLRYFKLEKGNRATDWSPAPDDIENDYNSKFNVVEQNLSTLTQTTSGISTEVSKKVNITTYNANNQAVSQQISNLSSRIDQTAGSIKGIVTQEISGLNAQSQSISNWFDFSVSSFLTIGQQGSAYKTQITNSAFNILHGNTTIGSFSATGLSTPSLTLTTSFNLPPFVLQSISGGWILTEAS